MSYALGTRPGNSQRETPPPPPPWSIINPIWCLLLRRNQRRWVCNEEVPFPHRVLPSIPVAVSVIGTITCLGILPALGHRPHSIHPTWLHSHFRPMVNPLLFGKAPSVSRMPPSQTSHRCNNNRVLLRPTEITTRTIISVAARSLRCVPLLLGNRKRFLHNHSLVELPLTLTLGRGDGRVETVNNSMGNEIPVPERPEASSRPCGLMNEPLVLLTTHSKCRCSFFYFFIFFILPLYLFIYPSIKKRFHPPSELSLRYLFILVRLTSFCLYHSQNRTLCIALVPPG